MKKNIPFILFIFCNLAMGQVVSNVENQTNSNVEFRALRLNKGLDNILNQLDELTAILEYLGQAIDKGAIKIENKADSQSWISNAKKKIKSIKKSQTLPILEKDLFQMGLLVTAVTKSIDFTIKSEFNNFIDVDDIIFKALKDKENITLAHVEESVDTNDLLIADLRKQANEAGLTAINIIARKLDDYNNRFGILKNIKNACIGIIAGAIGTYFAPRSWFMRLSADKTPTSKNLNVIQRFKENIGTLQLDPDIHPDHKDQKKDVIPRKAPSGWMDKILEVGKDPHVDFAMKLLAGTYLLIKSPTLFSPTIAEVSTYFRRWWDELKGFTVPNTTNFEFVDDIDLDSEILIGIDNQIQELRNLVRYISNPEIYDRSNSNLEKGILLTGPSRTGKTLVARALAGTLDKAFKEKGYNTRVGFKELKPKDITWNADGIKSVIEQAKQMAPCVLFIDEIHNLPLQSKEGGDTLTEFLTGMSGVNSENDARHQIILLAATNQPEMLDGALLQPGRFGTIIRFEKPTYANRKKYFDVMFKRNTIDASEIDVNLLVRQTEGCTYGDLETIIKNARFTARTLAKGVTQQHLQDRIDKHVHRLRDDLPPTEAEKQIISANLAGQALAHALLKTDKKLEFITLKGRWPKIVEKRLLEKLLIKDSKQQNNFENKSSWGYLCAYNESENLKLESLNEKEKLSKVRLAGAIAEKILLGSTSYCYRPKDKHKAFELAKTIVLDGMLESDLTKSQQQQLNKDALTLINKYKDEMTKLLTANQKELTAIATELKLKITLTVNDISAILK